MRLAVDPRVGAHSSGPSGSISSYLFISRLLYSYILPFLGTIIGRCVRISSHIL